MDTIKILLAGADSIFLEQVRIYLRNTGVELLSCRLQEETLGIMLQKAPDIVYLSDRIAGGGLECLRTIRESERLRRIPVVMVCSRESENFRENCRTAGCECLARKPLDRQTFLSSVMSFVQLDKRTDARFRIQVEVSFGVESTDTCRSRSVNLSMGGMFIESGQLFPVGTTLMMRFTLPSRPGDILCRATVAWLNLRDNPVKPSLPGGMGVEFFGLSPENSSRLSQFMHEEYISKLLTCSPAREPS